MKPNLDLVERVSRLARDLPQPVVDAVSAGLEGTPAFGHGLTACVLGFVQHAKLRDALAAILEESEEDPGLTPSALALVLRVAAHVDAHHRASQKLELAWTGPLPRSANLRRIDEALLERIPTAQSEVLIVTFAAWRPKKLEKALIALPPQVAITLIVETSHDSDGRYTQDPRERLAPELVARSQLFVWPPDQRLKIKDSKGKVRQGVLHAKCAVIDRRWLLVSSANFTDSAMEVNMEMGVAIEGGQMPGRVAKHFEALVAEGRLRRMG